MYKSVTYININKFSSTSTFCANVLTFCILAYYFASRECEWNVICEFKALDSCKTKKNYNFCMNDSPQLHDVKIHFAFVKSPLNGPGSNLIDISSSMRIVVITDKQSCWLESVTRTQVTLESHHFVTCDLTELTWDLVLGTCDLLATYLRLELMTCWQWLFGK